jgi:hypothetical protein
MGEGCNLWAPSLRPPSRHSLALTPISCGYPMGYPRKPAAARAHPGTIPPRTSGLAAGPSAAVRLLPLKNPRRPRSGQCRPVVQRPRGSQRNRLAKAMVCQSSLENIRFRVKFMLYFP